MHTLLRIWVESRFLWCQELTISFFLLSSSLLQKHFLKSRGSYKFIFYCFLYTSILKRGLKYKCIRRKDFSVSFSVSFKWKICPSNPSLNMLIINSRLPSLAYIEYIEPTSTPPVCVPGDLDGHEANTIVFQSLLYYRKLLLILAVQCSLSFFELSSNNSLSSWLQSLLLKDGLIPMLHQFSNLFQSGLDRFDRPSVAKWGRLMTSQ